MSKCKHDWAIVRIVHKNGKKIVTLACRKCGKTKEETR